MKLLYRGDYLPETNKTNSSPLKINGWKMKFLVGMGLC